MNITLTPDSESFVQSQVGQGLYKSVNDVVNEALNLLAKKEINLKIDKGLKSMANGDVISADESYTKLLEKRKSY